VEVHRWTKLERLIILHHPGRRQSKGGRPAMLLKNASYPLCLCPPIRVYSRSFAVKSPSRSFKLNTKHLHSAFPLESCLLGGCELASQVLIFA